MRMAKCVCSELRKLDRTIVRLYNRKQGGRGEKWKTGGVKMKGQLRTIMGEVAALRPVYTNTGDSTEIILINGNVVPDPRSIRSIYRILARFYAVDLVAARQHYRKLLGQANGIPLPFSAQLVFCPLKMRVPRCPGDFTLGYVSYRQVAEVKDFRQGDYRCQVVLQNGIRLFSLNRVAFLQKQMALARLVENHYLETQGVGSQWTEINIPTRAEFMLLETKLNFLLQNYIVEREKGFCFKERNIISNS
jgi:hypothetical protein